MLSLFSSIIKLDFWRKESLKALGIQNLEFETDLNLFDCKSDCIANL